MTYPGAQTALERPRSKSKTYVAWISMRTRCLRAQHKSYPLYGGRGITICPEWIESFEAFLRDMGEAPRGSSLDRIDNNGGYCKENCRWTDRNQQDRNKRTNRWLTLNGETLCLRDWELKLGLGRGSLHYRLTAGWPLERALTTKPRAHERRV